jgi:hypothetical protein
MAGFYSWK